MPRVSRALRMVRAADLLGRLARAGSSRGGARRPRASWADTVGSALAQVTALVGVERDGTLRCVAANEAARHDLLARQAHVLAAWNTVARARGGPRAERLVAWVAAHFRPQPPPAPRLGLSPGGPPAGPTSAAGAHRASPVAAEQGPHWERAQREAAGVKDPELRAALVRLRARALARRDAPGTQARVARTAVAETPPPPTRASLSSGHSVVGED